jgi:hypothetical protein
MNMLKLDARGGRAKAGRGDGRATKDDDEISGRDFNTYASVPLHANSSAVRVTAIGDDLLMASN